MISGMTDVEVLDGDGNTVLFRHFEPLDPGTPPGRWFCQDLPRWNDPGLHVDLDLDVVVLNVNYAAMRRLAGQPLQRGLGSPLPEAQAWRILRPIVEALALCHDMGTVIAATSGGVKAPLDVRPTSLS